MSFSMTDRTTDQVDYTLKEDEHRFGDSSQKNYRELHEFKQI